VKPRRRPIGLGLAVAAIALGIVACRQQEAPPFTQPAEASVLRVLAGSELKEIESALVAAARKVDVDLRLSYAGTLEIVDRVNAGERFDAVLPPNGAYPMLALQSKPLAREKLFYSRVALGVKRSKAQSLGWDRRVPTWGDVAQAAQDGRFNYAMTNPTSSNTGMSALFAVASSGAGKTEDLSLADVHRDLLTRFLKGQKFTAGSSGWLSDAYLRDQDKLDGIVNYEAVLMRLNDRHELTDKLAIVYPADGVISADYPLLLLNDARRPAYQRIVEVVRSREFQAGPVATAYLRPSNPDAPLASGLGTQPVAELSFPNNLAVIDAVLSAYQSELRQPATSIYLLDTSGSMKGERIAGLRHALEYLTGAGGNDMLARMARFQSRERVILLPFSEHVASPTAVEFTSAGNHDQEADAIRAFARELHASGGTAIFSAIEQAYAIASHERARDPDRLVTVVLLTDGENHDGIDFPTLERRLRGADVPRTFPILFGEGRSAELEQLARLSGGRVFDGRTGALTAVFREIRGYQ
jgi:Ca-activated chloride channel family protein